MNSMQPNPANADLRDIGMKISARCGKELDISRRKNRLTRRRIIKAEYSARRHFVLPEDRT
jgi:hypothetical protein